MNRRVDLVKLGRPLFVFGEYDIDLCVGRNRNHHAAVGIEAHHFRVDGRADILGQPLTKHVVLGERSAGVVPGHFCEHRTNTRCRPHQKVLARVLPVHVSFDGPEVETGADSVDLLPRSVQKFDLIEFQAD